MTSGAVNSSSGQPISRSLAVGAWCGAWALLKQLQTVPPALPRHKGWPCR